MTVGRIAALMVVGLGTVSILLALLVMWLDQMGMPDDGSTQDDLGIWYEVRPPPNAPSDVRCWVWQDGILDAVMGGPVCFEGQEVTPERPFIDPS